MTVSAINMFRLRPGVSSEEFEKFSVELDRPTCLGFDVVVGFEVFLTESTESSGVDVIEVMTVTSWPEWEKVRDEAPELEAVVRRFDQLVEPGSVSTLFARKSPPSQEI
ncbi:Uncharacterised protein [Mycolicibacterium vanbaalenii]|uniref:REDY-like protein HapK n=1 Tax=Mycolicibacterium vanbaalenii TaxID=110539 RepID=A0A5S9QHU3_MYCVN|nr:hypothetical protein [Mycolicibacterium vanbaalenii]CAA0117619.1 Uncharacterised protein [Mycolicibacterium vanbaalenii]